MLTITHEKEEARSEYKVSYFKHSLCSYLVISMSLTCSPNGHCLIHNAKGNSRPPKSITKQINRKGNNENCKIIGIRLYLGISKNKQISYITCVGTTGYIISIFYRDGNK